MSKSTSPACKAFSITPSDTVNLSHTTRGIYVGGTGNISLEIDGSAIVFNNVQAGSILPVTTTRVNIANTTATGLVGLY